ncbi:MAG: penicillin-binding protein 1B [Gammaproteobacteria bacterium]|jgi:penicillin-binding protein 1B
MNRKSLSKKTKNNSNEKNKSKAGIIFRALLLRLMLLTSGLLLLAGIGWLIYLDSIVQEKFSGKRWAVPARVYARPLELYQGAAVQSQDLLDELNRLGYQQTKSPQRAGQFAFKSGAVELVSRPFQFWDGDETAKHLRIAFDHIGIATLTDLDAQQAADLVRLDPLLIGSIHPAHGEDRILVQLDDLPETMIAALIAVEDKRYYDHIGVDLKSILRAVFVNVKAGGASQGGSTITQQLVKNFFLDSSRTIRRKLNEAAMALLLEFHFGKQEILEAYLNEIYLGQDGSRAIHGFGLAAYFYFGKPASELSLDEQALLVGMVKGPSYYNPRRNTEKATARRDLVLDVLVREEVITQAQSDQTKAIKVSVLGAGNRSTTRYPAFIDLVKRQLREDYRNEDIVSEGLRIYTTLDPLIQDAAESGVIKTLKGIEADRRMAPKGLQAAAVVTTVDGGEVLALVGGREPRLRGFNRAIDMQRPVGSLVKPAVYLAALRQPERFNLATLVDDTPLSVFLEDGSEWSPSNYGDEYHGTVPLYQALQNSWNTSTVRIGLDAGLENVGIALDDLGLGAPENLYPSAILGSVNRSPLDVAQMYQTLAAGGFKSEINAIREVRDAYGKPLQRYPLALNQTVSPEQVYLITTILQGAAKFGTGRALRWLLPRDYAIAGKTGTTNDMRDSWFAGYTGNRVGVVWVGRDDNAPAELTGSMGALKVWASILSASDLRRLDAIQPPGIEQVLVDLETGRRADKYCNSTVTLPFVTGSVPAKPAPCSRIRAESDGVVDWFRGWFR